MRTVPFQHNSFVFLAHTGCLLPFLILFNFLLGWVFLKPLAWLAVEALLILLFLLNSYLLAKRTSASILRGKGAIDTEAEVLEEPGKIEGQKH
jgi:hypothetical protein